MTITPTSATNTLKIEAVLFVTSTTTPWLQLALFQDSTANALAAVATFTTTSTAGASIPLTWYMTAGTTSATTFKIRMGPSNAATLTFNGQNGGRRFGGVMASTLSVTELAP